MDTLVEVLGLHLRIANAEMDVPGEELAREKGTAVDRAARRKTAQQQLSVHWSRNRSSEEAVLFA